MAEDEAQPKRLNEFSLERLIEFGAVIAQPNTEEAWSIIDSDYIPAIQDRARTADQKTLNEAYDKLNKYLDSDELVKRDYAGTVAGAIFRSVLVFDRSPAANRLVEKLKKVASEDAEIFRDSELQLL